MFGDKMGKEFDKNLFREELKALTKDERMLIIKEYERVAPEYGVDIEEYIDFLMFLNDIED